MTTLLIVTLLLWSTGWLLPGRMKACGDGVAKEVSADRVLATIISRHVQSLDQRLA